MVHGNTSAVRTLQSKGHPDPNPNLGLC